MRYGLTENVIDQIGGILKEFPEVEAALIYGSRAKGNFTPSSDIDMVLKGDNIDLRILNRIILKLDDMLLPYKIDLSIYGHITNNDLLSHIDRIGQTIYSNTLSVS
ncbi:nucleotidyltransferase domain-containing protein [Mucilaginibacter puniceus]